MGDSPPQVAHRAWQPSQWRITGVQTQKPRRPTPVAVLMMGVVVTLLPHPHRVVPRAYAITPDGCHICSYSIPQGQWMMTTKRANWRTSLVCVRGLVTVNLTSETITQSRESIAQHRPRSRLILWNPQLEQLVLQGAMLPRAGISVESSMRWTCVRSDAFWQLLSPRAETSPWCWSHLVL